MRNAALGVSIVLLALASADAASLTVTTSSAPTTDLPGFSTWTVSLSVDDGTITAVDATFEGPLNQINPSGVPTIFDDFNSFFGSTHVSQDSQFLFNSNDITTDGTLNAEGPDILKARFAFPAMPFQSGPVAQLVIPDGGMVNYLIQISQPGGVTVPEGGHLLGTIPVPETASFISVLIGLGLLGGHWRRR